MTATTDLTRPRVATEAHDADPLETAIRAIEQNQKQNVSMLHHLCAAWAAQNPGAEPLGICQTLARAETLLGSTAGVLFDLPGLIDLPHPPSPPSATPLHHITGAGNIGPSTTETLGEPEGARPAVQTLHSISSAARVLGVTAAAVRYWIKTGRLACEQANGRYYITENALLEANKRFQAISVGRPRSATKKADAR